jgi:thiamine-monophosphate kinase
VNEFELIYDLIAPLAGTRDDVLLGIGDDGALLAPPPGEALVVVADTLVEGRHFPPDMAAADVGWRAATVNLSDIAAMGATPRWATLALTLPSVDEAWLRSFVGGLAEALALGQVALVGGDTTRGPLTLTVQIIGSVPPAAGLTRRGARPGDAVFVSGTLGDAAGALALWGQGRTDGDAGSLIQRFRRPTPRLALGLALRGIASACIDVSDGLLADLGHIALQSGCGIDVDADSLPRTAALEACFDRSAALTLAATGGDDYELAFTVPQARKADVAGLALRAGVALHEIGRVRAGGGVRLRDGSGREIHCEQRGYTHF